MKLPEIVGIGISYIVGSSTEASFKLDLFYMGDPLKAGILYFITRVPWFLLLTAALPTHQRSFASRPLPPARYTARPRLATCTTWYPVLLMFRQVLPPSLEMSTPEVPQAIHFRLLMAVIQER